MGFTFRLGRMSNNTSICFLFPILLCVTLHAQELNDRRAVRVDSLFSYLNKSVSPGIALAIIKEGKVVLKKGYGYANLEDSTPITPATVFDIASLAKQFTGMLVAMLVTEGKIKTSDDIRKYIPEMHDFGKVITIDHLLHHTSGLRDWVGTLKVGGWRTDDPISFNDIMKMAYHQKTLNFDPGAEHLYSNTGYNILAQIIQKVTGKSLKQCVEERIFKPLQMTHSRVMEDYNTLIPNRALGYSINLQGSFRNTIDALTGFGSSSVFSSVEDLGNWLINFDNVKVGDKKVLELMKTGGHLNNGTEISYAFGIKTGSYRGLPMITHSGGWASYNGFEVYFPDQKFGIVVLSNSQAVDAQNAVIQLTNIYLESDFTPDPQSITSTGSTQKASIKNDIHRFSGLYKSGQNTYIGFEAIGSSLLGKIPGIGSTVVSPESESVFRVNEEDLLTFKSDSNDSITSVVYKGLNFFKMAGQEWMTKVKLDNYLGEYFSDELETTFRVIRNQNHIELATPRKANIPLTNAWPNAFSSLYFNFSLIEFQQNKKGQITGFVINGDPRSRNIRFIRR